MLSVNGAITAIDISKNKMTEKSCVYICEAIKKNPASNIQSINFGDIQIGADGAQFFKLGESARC